ncbi:MAG: hypothetical protein C0483_16305 [Pirellula sp.]|nr:hypothetical protein [Pirellula sp.]
MRQGSRKAILVAVVCLFQIVGQLRANDLSRDEEVVLFPMFSAFDAAAPTTQFFIHGWIFEPEADSKSRGLLLAKLAAGLSLAEHERLSPVFQERARLFLVDNERDQKLVARVAAREVPLTTSQPNGHIRSLVTLPTGELRKAMRPPVAAAGTLPFALIVPKGDARAFSGRVHLIGPEGWSVVSDIDDTIKASNVLDKAELMRNTFLREFRAVDGMAEAYREWSREGAAFHYVSGSPWQLYPALAKFADAEDFPQGSYHLRTFRLQDGSSSELLGSPKDFKLRTIEPILQAFPRRKFVFVGDSGEQDPEVYGELARRRPEQVRWIAIRNITNEVLGNVRLAAAFQGVPADRCLLFREPAELPAAKQMMPRMNDKKFPSPAANPK